MLVHRKRVCMSYLLLLLELGLAFLTLLFLALALLQQSLGDEDLFLCRHAPVFGQERQGQYSLPGRGLDNTSSRELQLRRCILGLEHRLDEMNLISETGTFATKLPSTEYKALRNRTNVSHPTRPQAMLKNDTRTCSSLP